MSLIYFLTLLPRDYAVGNITQQTIPTASLTNTTTYSGQTSYGGYTYQTTVAYTSGLLQNSSNGINHYGSVGAGLPTAIDGLVAVLNIKITARPQTTSYAFLVCPFFFLACAQNVSLVPHGEYRRRAGNSQ
jgi:hypothetical protein